MGIGTSEIFIALITALIPAFFAYKLGKELNR